MFNQYMKYFIVGATIVTGLVSLFWPTKVFGFTGLEVSGGRGITEIRSVLGALFIGLGVAVLYYKTPEVYGMLGIMYFAIAIARAIFMFVDKSVVSSNVISLVFEIFAGIFLFL